MPRTDYVLPVALDSAILIRHRVERGQVIEFMVQLVVQDKPVLRYDGAHGFAHIDRYNLKGEQKKELLNLSFSTALTLGEWDLKQNWPLYRARYLRGGYP